MSCARFSNRHFVLIAGVKSLLRFENHEEPDGFLSGTLVVGFLTGTDFVGAGTLFVDVLTGPAFLRSASSYLVPNSLNAAKYLLNSSRQDSNWIIHILCSPRMSSIFMCIIASSLPDAISEYSAPIFWTKFCLKVPGPLSE